MNSTMEKYILTLDQGTTSSRALIINKQGDIKAIAQKEFSQIFPKTGWVEHDPEEIWSSQAYVIKKVIAKAGINESQIAGIGITNQRETTIIWDRKTGEAVYNAIVWQDRRTAKYCDQLKAKGLEEKFRKKTGLVIDSYFSGTKVNWLLHQVEGIKQRADRGELAFGTVDSWLIWKLTQGSTHVTDVSNASRTLMFDIHTLQWDEDLLKIMGIPKSVLPEVKSSSEIYAFTNTDLFDSQIPIAGIAGDQQAAMFGQMCIEKGMVKNTYGTGCFMLLNTGDQPFESNNKLLTTVAWKIGEKTTYALEGSVFIAGAVVQWLRDELNLIDHSHEIEDLAQSVKDNGDVYFVPAFTGLGAPHWDQYARGTIVGLSRGTKKGHIARAALESIAFQTMDMLNAMQKDTGMNYSEIRVDGGASQNDLLMQFQSDILNTPVTRPTITETTALGAAYLAGLSTGFWRSLNEIKNYWKVDQKFIPQIDINKIKNIKTRWQNAILRSQNWIDDDC